MNEEALARELTGKFYLEMQSTEIAGLYLKSAYNAYREWGAVTKLANMSEQYPHYISSLKKTGTVYSSSTSVHGTTAGMSLDQLDLTTLLKASTAISGEIHLPKLLKTLLNIVMQNAGAQKGILLLETKGNLFIQAESITGDSETSVLQSIPFEGSGKLPELVIQFVQRTKDSIVIHEVHKDDRFNQDPYMLNGDCQSLLCIPIINQGKFIGIIYLENNLTTGAFTNERIELLSLLSGQIATSIDNAVLYNNIEKVVEERTLELETEKQKSDDLLLNILPLEIAKELKDKQDVDPRSYKSVTVLFLDFKNFTKISEELSPKELVGEINRYFSAIDDIMGRYRLEKIKTIGDSYMCAGGLPVPNTTHAVDTVRAALDIQEWLMQNKKEKESKKEPYFEARIGINTGPVIAGVVGTRKFAYDIWGATVNIASRIESSGEIMRVNISKSTFDLVKEKFDCTHRGKIAAKNKGEIDMYFVEGLKS